MKKYISFFFLFLLFFNSCATDPKEEAKKEMEEQLKREIDIGRSLAARLIKKYKLLGDQEATRYINLLGNSIGAISSRPEVTYYFGILDTDDINAFSCPGGYILITRGALKAIKDESELAFVLAHEISHVVLSHSIPKQKKSGGFVEFISNFLSGGGGLVNMAVSQASGQMEKMLLEGGRQKELEYEADQTGFIYASISMGYDYRSAINYLKRIKDSGDDEHSKTLTSTHPPYSERISKLQNFAKEQKLSESGKVNQPRFQKYLSPVLNAASSNPPKENKQ